MRKINEFSPQDNNFTQIIATIAQPPATLYSIGTLPTDRRPAVAIVGTRKPTKYGIEVTERLAYDLAKRGIVIISGMALGVDGIAHRAALEAGGTTIAVLGNGLDVLYPNTHRQLGENIVKSGGAIISEYDVGVPAYPANFLARNRIVSGLSDAIIITEAAARSGTLNTAGHALEQGKDIFVVPGNITSPLSTGCNRLLKQGAIPVMCAEDVLEVIVPHLLQPQAHLPLGDTPLQTKILRLLQAGIRDGDQLQAQSGFDASHFATELTMMEINGLIRNLGANQWTLR
jgi:DNA processing protein